MKSLRLFGPHDFRMLDENIPLPGRGEVQIKVKSVGVCASDVHWYVDGRIGSTVATEPLVLGHEASGEISALGEGVSGFKIGDRIAIEPAKPCMTCEYCLSGHYNVCPNVSFFGTPPTDGCYREYITWPANLALKVPENISFDEAAMLEPLAVGIYAVELADLKETDTLVVLGAGAIGLSTIQAAKQAGVKQIIVSEPVKERRELAIKLGATAAFDPSIKDVSEEIHKLTGGRGADVIFECTGDKTAINDSAKMVKILGKLMIIGIPDEDIYPIDASSARRKELHVIFVRRSNLTTEKAIEWTAEGKVDIKSYCTHHFKLEDTQEAMELMLRKTDGVIRAIIKVA